MHKHFITKTLDTRMKDEALPYKKLLLYCIFDVCCDSMTKGPVVLMLRSLEEYGLLEQVRKAVVSGDYEPKEKWKGIVREHIHATVRVKSRVQESLTHQVNCKEPCPEVSNTPGELYTAVSRSL